MIKVKACTHCGVKFNCGVTEEDGSCWCTALPNIVPMPEVGDCLCPACLNERIEEIRIFKAKDSTAKAGK
jgi:hypothetical protein